MLYRPYEYQKTATRWILEHPRCGLFLDMGLGKTVSTLTAVQQLIDDCEIDRTLVVAPKKVAETTWSTEAEKWEHLKGLKVVKVMGTERQRKMALDTPADVYKPMRFAPSQNSGIALRARGRVSQTCAGDESGGGKVLQIVPVRSSLRRGGNGISQGQARLVRGDHQAFWLGICAERIRNVDRSYASLRLYG